MWELGLPMIPDQMILMNTSCVGNIVT